MKSTPSNAEPLIGMSNPANYNSVERQYFERAGGVFEEASGTTLDKLHAFSRFIPRQALATFLAKEELFKLVRNVHGHIIEGGVHRGAGLFSWAQLSSILEPYNHTRRIYGFDTFAGFPGLAEQDGDSEIGYKQEGGLAANPKEELQEAIELFDMNRLIGQIPRVELVEGDACETIPEFVAGNPHLVVALLYLDFDLYEPTKVAIERFWPRMPVGSVIAFDELNQSLWPGETQAVDEVLGLSSLEIRRFEFTPQISYAIKR